MTLSGKAFAPHVIQHSGSRRNTRSLRSDLDMGAEWAAFLIKRFDTNAQAAKAFGVDERAVRFWINQDRRPSGLVVARAVLEHGFLQDG